MSQIHQDDWGGSSITLDQFITYDIRIVGKLTQDPADYMDNMEIRIKTIRADATITVLVVTVDQAGLLGLLRQLYYLGYPLISVNRIEQPNNNP